VPRAPLAGPRASPIGGLLAGEAARPGPPAEASGVGRVSGLLAEAEELLQETVAMALPLASGAEVAAWGAASRRSSRPAEGGPAGCRGEAVEPERPVRAAEQWLGRRWGTTELSARLEEVCRDLDSVAALCGGGG